MSKHCPIYGIAIYADCLECDNKLCRKENVKKMKYNKITIGIDQSYKRTGITIIADNQIKKITYIDFKHFANNSEKRGYLREKLDILFKNLSYKSDNIIVVIERIRLRSEGFLNINYIKSIGALNAVIIDCAVKYAYPIYSADTRAWKSKIVGTSKPQNNNYYVDPKKWPTIKYVCSLGHKEDIIVKLPENTKIKKYFIYNGNKCLFNDDAADSCCIALYGNLPKNQTTLKEEK
jgi:hypothetical protein